MATTARKPDGSRAIGLKMGAGSRRDAVYGQGQAYTGPTDLAGVPFFSSFRPIGDGSAKLIGSLVLGNPLSVAIGAIDRVVEVFRNGLIERSR